MAFSIAARTLLELGKELISTDEVAIYEIVKNAIDAASPKVEVFATVVLSHRHLVEALEILEDGGSIAKAREVLEDNVLANAPAQPRTAFSRGLSSARAKNAADFATDVKKAYAATSWIDFVDTGHGMTLKELSDVFLRIGTNSRHVFNASGAKYLGDKGVGRLSTMRLGDILSVKTATKADRRWNLLDIDWRIFSHEIDVDLDQIALDPGVGDTKPAGLQGTRIRVSCLSADWSSTRFRAMFEGKIARLIDPFLPGRANELLTVRHNGDRVLVPSIPSLLLKDAHATCRGQFYFEGDEPIVSGDVAYRLRQKEVPIRARGSEVTSVAQHSVKRRGKKAHAASAVVPIRIKALKELGPFSFEIYWYNRRVVEAVEDLTDAPGETKTEIARWAGGPMLYRGDFRILPYGEPNNDWLALDQIAFGASGFKLNRQQVIGRVKVDSPHAALGEQTNREGLMATDASDALRTIMYWVVHTEMRGLINSADKIEKINKRIAEEAALGFRQQQELVRESLLLLRKDLAERHRPLADRVSATVEDMAEQCASMVKRIDLMVKQAVTEREKFVHLAGIGLMTEFIFHELDRSVVHTLALIGDAKRSERAAVLQSLEAQLHTLQKRIAVFDELAGERRQSKSTFDLRTVVQLVLDNHANEFRRHAITATFEAPRSPYPVKAVRGMVVQILENLVVNATYWLKRQKRWEANFRPALHVKLDQLEDVLSVEDNGPGVDPARAEHIFQPFVSSKPADQGRGLGLFISRDMAEHNGWTLTLDPETGRQREGRSNMFVLDMGN